MNEQPSIRSFEKDATLTDGVKVRVLGETFEKPIWPSGDVVYVSVKILNARNGAVMGIAYFRDAMELSELKDKVEEISENPEPYLAPIYKATSQN